MPTGASILGVPGDGNLIGAGFTHTGFAAVEAWTPTSMTGAPTARVAHTIVWTGRLMLVWGGFRHRAPEHGRHLRSGHRRLAADDDASALRRPGYSHTAVWTGSRMIVWGGDDGGLTATGGQYDPVADAWSRPASTARRSDVSGTRRSGRARG